MVAYPGVSPAFAPTGITGAVAATRYVGGTTSGKPVTGTFSVGDFVIDQTGHVYICTVAGSVGTWIEVGALQATTDVLNAGTNTAGSAPVITAIGATSGVSKQLSDLTRDYMVYLEVTTSGTATSISLGSTNAASDITILSSVAVTAGNLYSFRLPAGWWFKWTGTTTAIGNQNALGC